jgi:hypothetical protein
MKDDTVDTITLLMRTAVLPRYASTAKYRQVIMSNRAIYCTLQYDKVHFAHR